MRGFLAFLIVGIVAIAAIVGISIVRGQPISLIPLRQGNVASLPPNPGPTPQTIKMVPAEEQPLVPGEAPVTNHDLATDPGEMGSTPEPGLSDSSNQGRTVDTPTEGPLVTPANPAPTKASSEGLKSYDTVASANAPESKPQAKAESKPAQKSDAKAPAEVSKETTTPPDAKYTLVDGKLLLTEEAYKNGYHKGEPVVVVVDPSSHFTYLFQKQAKNKIALVYRASNATGNELTQTPYGRFHVTQKTKWPAWVPPKGVDPEQKAVQPFNKDRKNPLGVARIRLNKWDIALHGTNNPASIRQNASKGCIRHSNGDIEKIFSMVGTGDRVIVTKKLVGTTLTAKDFKGGPA